MKKLSLAVLSLAVTMGYAAAQNTRAGVVDMTGGPVVRETNSRIVYKTVEETEVYKLNAQTGRDLYYSDPYSRAAIYDGYTGCNYAGECDRPTPVARPVPVRTERRAVVAPAPAPEPRQAAVRRDTGARMQRGFYLADPFFQPTAGHFGGRTELGWAQNTYDFAITDMSGNGGGWDGVTGDWETSEMFIRQNISFGITDNILIMGEARYAMSDYKMGWDGPIPDDKDDDSGFNPWGLGLQWRFTDTADWVGIVGAYYQSYELMDAFTGDVRVGYKIDQSKIYALARMMYINWDGNSYGDGIQNDADQVAFISFDDDVKNSLYWEVGVGAFVALAPEWSLDVHAIYADFEWHAQIRARASLHWQPSDNFAIGVYGGMSLYDTANSEKHLHAFSWDATTAPIFMGDTAIKNYRDVNAGIEALYYF
ncbi:MAG: hypothetical protein LBR41_02170 [Rickettsiales bacterium]|jgi:hypothetical protein|nr:hypothetical protein [Rickettsiales bacterium]